MSEDRASSSPSRARVGGFALAWVLSVLPLLAAGELERSLGDTSRLLLASLPWIGFIGLPRIDRTGPLVSEERRGGSRDWLLALGLAMPPLFLAGWTDLRAGLERDAVLGIASFVAASLLLLGEAGHQASRGASRLHGFCWLAIVPGAAALSAALSWAIEGRAAESGLAGALAAVSPIATLWRDFTGEPIALGAAVLRPASVACALLLVIAWLAARRREANR